MSYKKPESLEGLDLEALRKLNEQAFEEARALIGDENATPSTEEIEKAEALMADSAEFEARIAELETAERERAERVAALRERTAKSDPEPEGDEDGDSEQSEGDEPEEETQPAGEPGNIDEAGDAGDSADAEAVSNEQENELVTASAGRPNVMAQAARNGVQEEAQVAPPAGVTLIAAAEVPNFSGGQEFKDFSQVAEAFLSRAKSFRGTKATGRFDRFGVARIEKPENEFTLDRKSTEEQMEVILAAASESRLPGGSLVAAGGWCAPSETIYDSFLRTETVDGILSIPEVTWSRGGISFTKGPDYAALAADWGFLQTEAEAEAGTEKVCYEVDCPDFDEVRLDAVGFCIKAGILTNTTYPELIRRVLEIGAVAHAHKVNAQVIQRIQTYLGAAVDFTEVGGGATDLIGGIELQAEVLRYRYSMAIGATIEVVLPAWARLVVRQDLANRNGVDFMSITDAQITAYFAVRNLNVQWVYDYQPLPTSGATVGQALPGTVEAMLYPAGSFVKGTTDVIDLDTVYDSTGLSTNTYTAAFFEEGLAVANTGAGGIRVSIALNTNGASGFPAIGAGEGITFAAA